MFSTEDTIVAIATPPGRGGIGVVRISGSDSVRVAGNILSLASPLEPRHATLTTAAADRVVATYFPAPHSYTGEHVVEISAHGSPVVLTQILADAMSHGARLAEPGEFTLRAFLNGRVDLVQAEAVADLIDAVTPVQARAAFDQLQGTLTERIGVLDGQLFDLIARLEASLDFPDEGYHFIQPAEVVEALRSLECALADLVGDARRGRMVREGVQVAIVGRPNVGKSSLFNALVGTARAIVTAVPGTTRDLVTETIDLDGLRADIVDTAGLRETADAVEIEGVERARRTQSVADVIVVVLDGSQPLTADDQALLEDTRRRQRVVAVNKSDLAAAWDRSMLDTEWQSVSAATGAGVDAIRHAIGGVLNTSDPASSRDTVVVTNVRHASLLERAHGAVRRARAAAAPIEHPAPEEMVLVDLHDARAALEEITGKRTTDDLLREIFSRFCIGK